MYKLASLNDLLIDVSTRYRDLLVEAALLLER